MHQRVLCSANRDVSHPTVFGEEEQVAEPTFAGVHGTPEVIC